MLADTCADPIIFARVVQARLPENSSNNVFVFFVLNFYSFTVAYQWFISKKSIILLGFGWGGGGVQPIPRGQTFSMGAGGTNANPLSPLWIRACDHLTTRN